VSVAVIVDSAAALPEDVASQHGIAVVPINLTVGNSTYRDGELDLDELLERLDEGVTTSGPTPGEFAKAMEVALVGSDSVVVLTVSASISSTYQAACMAADMVHGDIRVVDTRTAAGAEALVAVAAARRALEGASLDEVEAAARSVSDAVRLVATVDRLDRLVQSGRVPSIAGWAGRQLGVNPLFEFREGTVNRLRPALSRDAALNRISSACRTSRPPGEARLHAAALHAKAPDAAQQLLDAVLEEGAESFVGPFSPAMVAHTGAGLAGLAWWWEPETEPR